MMALPGDELTDMDAIMTALPRVTLPPLVPPTPEEIARRRELFDRAMALREEIGPIGVRTDELVHETRDEADGAC